MTPKEVAIKNLTAALGDDLERAEAAFRHCTEAQLDEEYRVSGQTRREILEGYRRQRLENLAALEWARRAEVR